MSGAYYNEIDKNAAAWLAEVVNRRLIAPGPVDTRSIADVGADELSGYAQSHFFAGIGGWPYALRLAGWPPSRAVWTGSCPCPPFSAAGKGSECPSCGGKSCLSHPLVTAGWVCLDCGDEWRGDDRHLLPEFIRLIGAARPATVFGEQVASRDGLLWLETLRATLGRCGYAVLAADLPAAGVGAPHIRQRIFWRAERLADASGARAGRDAGAASGAQGGVRGARHPDGCHGGDAPVAGGAVRGLADADGGEPRQARRIQRSGEHGQQPKDGGIVRLGDGLGAGLEGHGRDGDHRDEPGRLGADAAGSTAEAGATRGLADNKLQQRQIAASGGDDARGWKQEPATASGLCGDLRPGPTNGFWRGADWLGCRDGKWRPVEPGTFPLAHGLPARVGRLRGYGNAIVPQVAAEFIRASEEAIREVMGVAA